MTGSHGCFPFESVIRTKKRRSGNRFSRVLVFFVAPEVETVFFFLLWFWVTEGSGIMKRFSHCERRQCNYEYLLVMKYCMNKCLALLSLLSAYCCCSCPICVYFLHSLTLAYSLSWQCAWGHPSSLHLGFVRPGKREKTCKLKLRPFLICSRI